MAIEYCTAQNVADLLQLGTVGTDFTKPTQTHIEVWIESEQDYIDQFTHRNFRTAGVTVTDEYYDVSRFSTIRTQWWDWSDRMRIYLRHYPIKTLTSGSGDKLEVWDGSTYIDFLTAHTEGRGNDYWVEDDRGIIHFANRYPYRRRNGVRMTYRWGDSSIPKDIELACTLLVAAHIVRADDYAVAFPEGTSHYNWQSKVKEFNEEAHTILERRRRLMQAIV